MDIHVGSMNSTVHTTDSRELRRIIREEIQRAKRESEGADRAAQDRRVLSSASDADASAGWE